MKQKPKVHTVVDVSGNGMRRINQSIIQYPFINEKVSKRTLGQKIGEINVNIASNNKTETQI